MCQQIYRDCKYIIYRPIPPVADTGPRLAVRYNLKISHPWKLHVLKFNTDNADSTLDTWRECTAIVTVISMSIHNNFYNDNNNPNEIKIAWSCAMAGISAQIRRIPNPHLSFLQLNLKKHEKCSTYQNLHVLISDTRINVHLTNHHYRQFSKLLW